MELEAWALWEHPGERSGCVISSPFPRPVAAAPGAFVSEDKDFSVFPDGLNKG